MKKVALLLIVLAAVAVGLVFAYHQFSEEKMREQNAEKPVSLPSRVERGPRGETIVRLDAAAQKRIGLEITSLAATNFTPEMKVYGRVLDPAPLTALVAEIAAAQVAFKASQREHARLKQLFEAGQNAPARAVEAAETAMHKDRVALEALRERLTLQWGAEMAAHSDLPGLARQLSARALALVQFSLPGGIGLKTPPARVRLAPATDEEQVLTGVFFAWAPQADTQTQSRGWLYGVEQSQPRLVPGVALVGWLPLDDKPLSGVCVPRNAVVRAAGRAWVYVQTAEDAFSRHEVNLTHPLADGWLVSTGLAENERVVTTGAQMLLSEESKSQIRLME